MRQPLDLFGDPIKNEAARTRPPCAKCGSDQMQLMNHAEPVERWAWRCRVCKTYAYPPGSKFMVVRGDDNGTMVCVADDLEEGAAVERYKSAARGHKQWYAMWHYRSEEERQTLIKRHNVLF